MLAFEDLPVGTVLRAEGYEVTETEIIAFAQAFDPQVMHLDPERAKATPVKGLIAPGMLTCSIAMRLAFDAFISRSLSLGAPGVDETRWLRPVRPGMVLASEQRVIGARVSRSRPQMGLLSFEAITCDQTGEPVMTQSYTAMYGRRDPAAPIPEAEGPARAPEQPAADVPQVSDDPIVGRTRFAKRYEDVVVGARIELGTHTFTRESIIAFASKYDPQPFHLSDEGAANSHFGRLAASGWQTAATYMRLFVETRDRVRAEAAQLPFALSPGRPSPGFRNLRWLRPVHAGDTLTYDTTVIGKEPYPKPGYGVARNRATAVNQNGVKVFEIEGTSLVTMG